MRRPLLLWLFLLTGCRVSVEGALCDSNANCPRGQFCVSGVCKLSPGSDAGAADGGCTSDPGCKSLNSALCVPADLHKVGTCTDVGGGCLKLQLVDCPSPDQLCNAGQCTCPPTACLGGQTTCQGDSVATCKLDVAGGCGSYPQTGTTCAAPTTCQTSDAGASCGCPAAIPSERGCCAAEGQTGCGPSDQLFRCQLDVGVLGWRAAEACPARGLVCETPSTGAAQCACPANGSNTFFADPVQGSPADAGAWATGRPDPPWCRFLTLSDALAAAASYTGSSAPPQVHPVWPAYPRWRPNTGYRANEEVIPTVANGHRYRANGAGQSAATEPAWPIDGGAVSDGTVNWIDAPDPLGDRTVFSRERFPLVVPPRTTLAGTCPGANGPGCDANRFVVGLNPVLPAPAAMVWLSPNSTLNAITLGDNGGPPAAAALGCGEGTATAAGVLILGKDTAGLTQGIRTDGTCSLEVIGSVVSGFDIGVWQQSTGAALRLSGVYLGALPSADGGISYPPNRLGMEIRGGTVWAEPLYVVGSKEEGITVSGATAQVVLDGGAIFGSGNSGVVLQSGRCRLAGTTVTLNGLAGGGKLYPGIYAGEGRLDVVGNDGGRAVVGANGLDGIRIVGGTAQALLENVDVSMNGGFGVAVNQASSVQLRFASILGNSKGGVSLSSADGGGSITATVDRCEIADNAGPGLFIAQSPGNATTSTVVDNRIVRNGFDAGTPAGVVFQNYSVVPAFTGNTIGGNNGPEISYRQTLGNWQDLDLSAQASALCASPNRLFCYGGSAADGTGVENQGFGTGTVKVGGNFIWAAGGAPATGVDYSGLPARYDGLASYCAGDAGSVCP